MVASICFILSHIRGLIKLRSSNKNLYLVSSTLKNEIEKYKQCQRFPGCVENIPKPKFRYSKHF